MQHGYQCGMVWGAAMAAGAQAHELYGSGPKAETAAINASQKIVNSFRDLKNTINCFEITNIDKDSSSWEMFKYFFIKGGSIGCFRMAAEYAPIAYQAIAIAFAEEPSEVPSLPVSCAAIVAKNRGLSDQHAVMASGFAGGIGLSGGACGALGAAIWDIGMKHFGEKVTKSDFKHPKGLELIEKFIKLTDYEFECANIVGHSFRSVTDHAAYLNEGGCDKLIEVLSSD